MKFKERTLVQIADMICGNAKDDKEQTFFKYRSSSYLTEFFRDADTEYVHDGSTRRYWVADRLRLILEEPHQNATIPPDVFLRVIKVLMDPEDACGEGRERLRALAALNAAIAWEGFEAFTPTISNATSDTSRPMPSRNLS